MNELQIFNNPEFGEVRTAVIDNEPWFVGKDVATALGYAKPRNAINEHVDDDDKKMGPENGAPSINDNLGREQFPTFINESGVYALVFGSKLPTAKQFKHWVTHDVLPSIRKHGAYATKETLEKALTSPDFGIRLLTELKKEQEKNARQAAELEAAKPKVVFAEAVATSKTSILVGELAKLIKQNGIDIGQNRLFEWLRVNKYLISRKGSDYNLPTQRSMQQGLFEIKESSHVNGDGVNIVTKTPKVTGKGQQYFINRFLAQKDSEETAAE